jgi:hypothetical protein
MTDMPTARDVQDLLKPLTGAMARTADATEAASTTLTDSDTRLVILANLLTATNALLTTISADLATVKADIATIKGNAANLKPNVGVTGIIATAT